MAIHPSTHPIDPRADPRDEPAAAPGHYHPNPKLSPAAAGLSLADHVNLFFPTMSTRGYGAMALAFGAGLLTASLFARKALSKAKSRCVRCQPRPSRVCAVP